MTPSGRPSLTPLVVAAVLLALRLGADGQLVTGEPVLFGPAVKEQPAEEVSRKRDGAKGDGAREVSEAGVGGRVDLVMLTEARAESGADLKLAHRLAGLIGGVLTPSLLGVRAEEIVREPAGVFGLGRVHVVRDHRPRHVVGQLGAGHGLGDQLLGGAVVSPALGLHPAREGRHRGVAELGPAGDCGLIGLEAPHEPESLDLGAGVHRLRLRPDDAPGGVAVEARGGAAQDVDTSQVGRIDAVDGALAVGEGEGDTIQKYPDAPDAERGPGAEAADGDSRVLSEVAHRAHVDAGDLREALADGQRRSPPVDVTLDEVASRERGVESAVAARGAANHDALDGGAGGLDRARDGQAQHEGEHGARGW